MEWQPIASAPKDGTEILCWWPHHRRATVGYYRRNHFGEGWRSFCEKGGGAAFKIDSNPTHWQPLPPPPKEQP